MTTHGEPLPQVELRTASGEQVELGAFLDRMLLAVAIRYYG
jgi:hypothetical protein